MVMEAQPVIYLFYLGSELILIDIRKPFSVERLSRANSWSPPSWVSLQLVYTSCGVRLYDCTSLRIATESGLLATKFIVRLL
jgi:hypothetical protein